jgi:hypothetical protein
MELLDNGSLDLLTLSCYGRHSSNTQRRYNPIVDVHQLGYGRAYGSGSLRAHRGGPEMVSVETDGLTALFDFHVRF